MAEYELGVIGGGNMAEAILRGVAAGGVVAMDRIVVSEPLEQRRRHLANEPGVACVPDNTVPASCSRILLAVKPQMMGQVLDEIAPAVGQQATVVSIAAGVTTATLEAGLRGKGRIVRVMPNTPMLVGAGVSAVAAGPRAGDEEVRWTCELFSASGKALVVAEPMIDAVTAVSGSGPAYFCYLVEAMAAAGVAEGLSPDVALELARQTCLGTGKLMIETGVEPDELRRRVTSPGGTTQRAVEALEAAGVKDRLVEAVRAAAERSRELGA